jgi:hypothetical protein
MSYFGKISDYVATGSGYIPDEVTSFASLAEDADDPRRLASKALWLDEQDPGID